MTLKKLILRPISKVLRLLMKNNTLRRKVEPIVDNAYYPNTYNYPYRAYEAMQCLLKNYEFSSVLDIGCGEGIHSNVFLDAGKDVTAIDYGQSYYFKKMEAAPRLKCIVDDFMKHDFKGQTFDCVWCSHVLEHQLNVHDFLKKVVSLLELRNGGGVLAITVPPYHPTIVGGHVSLWNAGLLIYNLVLAGLNCADARIKTYGYNVSVIVKRDDIDLSGRLSYDLGDLRAIKKYLPSGLEFFSNENDDPYYGNVRELNWL